MCGRTQRLAQEAGPGGRLVALPRPAPADRAVLWGAPRAASPGRGRGPGCSSGSAGTEELRCTDGGAAACTVVGPPSAAEQEGLVPKSL